MSASPEFLAASRRMRKIGEELLEIKQQQLRAALKGPEVRDVVVEQTIATLKIRCIKIMLTSGRILTLRASGIEGILVQQDRSDSRILELEQEWKTLNKKWHLYP